MDRQLARLVHLPPNLVGPSHSGVVLRRLQRDFYSVENPGSCPKCASKNVRQDEDTLDTWFSSGARTFSTLGWRMNQNRLEKISPDTMDADGLRDPVFLDGQNDFDVLMRSTIFRSKEVYIHGMVRGQRRPQFSKSSATALIRWKLSRNTARTPCV
jgi:valyl-tRNA synthetase